MKHLILCREYPPAPYPPGGIGTYVAHISRALAERGETVHVIGQRWEGADKPVERLCGGRLIVHRISADDSGLYPTLGPSPEVARAEVKAMLGSGFPAQWFSWVAAGLAERLIEAGEVDVVEGQEWEAPLYYLMLRRALGLGPARTPPCIVHLHSPTEFIFRHNEWSLARPDYLPMKRLEDYVIRSADAHLCPSRYLAEQCGRHYGLDRDVEVIPLPLGDTRPLARDAATWSNGSICYVGRLEPRKGVVEWVDAAVAVAQRQPTPTFAFIGADLPYTDALSVRQFVERRIPSSLRDRFVFHDARPRAEMLRMLAGARTAVVPSRWENYPNTCLEALCTGLPVIATRNGGMPDMVEDGRTGWLAPDGPEPLADRLAAALRRALAVPPAQLAAMGEAAAVSIRRICDNVAVADRHIAFRREVMARGAVRSAALPAALPWPERPARPRPARAAQGAEAAAGVAVAVIALGGRGYADRLAALAAQTSPPSAVVVVADRPDPDARRAGAPDHRLLSYPGSSTAAAKRLAVERHPGPEPIGWLFLEDGDELEPWALARFEAALRARAEIGVVTAWSGSAATRGAEPARAAPPAFPYQWLSNEFDRPTVYRAQALREAGGVRAEIDGGHEEWDLANAIMANGWIAARVPALLGIGAPAAAAGDAVPLAHSRARRSLLERFPELLGADAAGLVALLEANGPAAGGQAPRLSREQFAMSGSILRRPLREQAALVRAAVGRPVATAHWLLWRGKNIVKRRLVRARDALVGGRAQP